MTVTGGSGQAGSPLTPGINLTAASVMISGQASPPNPFWPNCPATPISNVTVQGMTLGMGDGDGAGQNIGTPYLNSSANGNCISVIGLVSGIRLIGNTCSNDPDAKGQLGLFAASVFGGAPSGVEQDGNVFNVTPGSLSTLIGGPNDSTIEHRGNLVNGQQVD
ncbi:MAG: hypothetical protein ACLQAT_19050 [Candidatus Binataceae bacterium]